MTLEDWVAGCCGQRGLKVEGLRHEKVSVAQVQYIRGGEGTKKSRVRAGAS